MSFRTEEYYQKFLELQEKLRKSEEERLVLEIRFNEMEQKSREEEQLHYRRLRHQYRHFLEEEKQREFRNESILRALERVELKISILKAKTERFKTLKNQYQTYLRRICSIDDSTPSVKITCPSIIPPPNDNIGDDVRHIRGQNEILDRYLNTLGPTTRAPRSVSNFTMHGTYAPSGSNYDSHSGGDYQRQNEPGSVADEIMNTIYSKPKNPAAYKGYEDDLKRIKDAQNVVQHRHINGDESGEDFVYPNGNNRSQPKSSTFLTNMERKIGDIVDEGSQLLQQINQEADSDQHYQDILQQLDRNKTLLDDQEFNMVPPNQPSQQMYPDDQPKDDKPFQKYDENGQIILERNGQGQIIQQYDHQGQPVQHFTENGDLIQQYTVEGQPVQLEIQPASSTATTFNQPVLENDQDKSIVSAVEVENVQPELKESEKEQNDEIQKNDQPTKSEMTSNEKQVDISKTLDLEQHKKDADIEVNVTVEVQKREQPSASVVKPQQIKNQNEKNQQLSDNQSKNDDNQPQQFSEPEKQENQQTNKQTNQQYDDKKPIVENYDENNQPVLQYDESGQPVQQYDATGQPSQQYDESGQPTQQYDESDQPLYQQYDENGQPYQQYDENGQPMLQYDENGQLLQQYENQQYDENGQPIQQYSEQQYDENGQPLYQQYDNNGQPYQQYDENGQPLQQYDENGQPLQQYDENGQPLQQYDENNQPLQQYDGNGQPLQQYDANGQHLQQYDENGQPLQQYDQNGQLLQQYDENGQLLQQYNNTDQPQQQYDESGELLQQNGVVLHQDNQKNDDNQPVQHEDIPAEQGDQNTQQLPNDNQPVHENNQENVDSKVKTTENESNQEIDDSISINTKNDSLPLEENMTNDKKATNLMEMLETDTESAAQEAKVSNDSDFDFSNP